MPIYLCDAPEWHGETDMDSVYVCMTYAGRVHSVVPIQVDEDTDACEGDCLLEMADDRQKPEEMVIKME